MAFKKVMAFLREIRDSLTHVDPKEGVMPVEYDGKIDGLCADVATGYLCH
jgi:hypothetical protein